MTKTATPNPVAVGATLMYLVTVRNNGSLSATGVTLTDTLPAGVTLTSATPTQGTCDGSVSCNVGVLASGASATVTILVRPTTAGSIDNTATVTVTAPGRAGA